MRPQRLLITGANGFVGRRLASAVERAWPRTAILALGHTRSPNEGPGVRTAQVDLSRDDPTALIAEFKPDAVAHLAAKASVGLTTREPRSAVELNLAGSLRLARAVARAAPGAHFLFVSTGEVYGRAFLERPIADEETPPQPQGVYARSKLAAEWVIEEELRGAGPLTICRPFNHSGAGQSADFVLPAFAEQIAAVERAGEGVVRVGDLAAARDFLHVEDVVDAYLRLLDRTPGEATEVYNIASGRPTTVQSLLGRMLELSGATIRTEVDPARLRPSQIPSAAGDARRLRAAIGWSPSHSLDSVLSEVLDDWRARVAARSA